MPPSTSPCVFEHNGEFCKFSDKRDIEVIVEGKVRNVKRRFSDCSKDYGLQGLKSFYV
jgi:hypothetical protein